MINYSKSWNWNWVETETEFIAKFKKLKKIIYNTMIVMNLAKEPGEASL